MVRSEPRLSADLPVIVRASSLKVTNLEQVYLRPCSQRITSSIALASSWCAPGARRFDTSSSQSLTCKRTIAVDAFALHHEAHIPRSTFALRTCFVTRPCSRRRPTMPASICRVSLELPLGHQGRGAGRGVYGPGGKAGPQVELFLKPFRL